MKTRRSRIVGALTALLLAAALFSALGGWGSVRSGTAAPSPTSSATPTSASSATPSPTASATTSPTPSSGGTSPTPSFGGYWNYLVTVALTGAPNGTVQSTPAGISCPGTCSARFTAGTVVTLTPMAAPPPVGTETHFSGFTGGCSGLSCAITVNADTSVSASFTNVPLMIPLTISAAAGSTGSILVLSLPAGISCGSTCSAQFAYGTVVTLNAVPAMGSRFDSWGGACASFGAASCTITLTSATDVSVHSSTLSTPP